MSEVWKTKYGLRKVRFDPPTLKEAVFAAQGMTGDFEQQAEIAAALMQMPVEDVRAGMSAMVPARHAGQTVTSVGRDGGARQVIVERKPSRHFTSGMAGLRPGSAKPHAARSTHREEDRQFSLTLLRRGMPGKRTLLV